MACLVLFWLVLACLVLSCLGLSCFFLGFLGNKPRPPKFYFLNIFTFCKYFCMKLGMHTWFYHTNMWSNSQNNSIQSAYKASSRQSRLLLPACSGRLHGLARESPTIILVAVRLCHAKRSENTCSRKDTETCSGQEYKYSGMRNRNRDRL
jgi:hypothetical protein